MIRRTTFFSTPRFGALAGIGLASMACNALVGGSVPGTDTPRAPNPAGSDGGAQEDGGSVDAGGADVAVDAPVSTNGPYPALTSIEIAPFYYGDWTPENADAQQAKLVATAQYITGANANAFTQPVLAQYGVTSAFVDPPVMQTSSGDALDTSAVLGVIHEAQKQKRFVDYAHNRLVLFLVPKRTMLAGECATYGAEGIDRNYAIVSTECDSGPLSSLRVVFAAAVDPSGVKKPGASKGPCFGSVFFSSFAIPSFYDESADGCSATGYDPTDEVPPPGSFSAIWRDGTDPQIQINGWSKTAFTNRQNELSAAGWRLKALDTYVFNDEVLYNAVWRPGNQDEELFDEDSSDALKARFTDLSSQGWRAHVITSYVLHGEVRYTTVWNRGTQAETPIIGMPVNDFKTKYAALSQAGSRLKLLRGYVLGDELFVTAVYYTGNDEELVTLGEPQADFLTHYNQIFPEPNNYRLLAYQAILLKGQPVVACIWRRLGGRELPWYQSTNLAYRNADDDARGKGYRTEILSAYGQ